MWSTLQRLSLVWNRNKGPRVRNAFHLRHFECYCRISVSPHHSFALDDRYRNILGRQGRKGRLFLPQAEQGHSMLNILLEFVRILDWILNYLRA